MRSRLGAVAEPRAWVALTTRPVSSIGPRPWQLRLDLRPIAQRGCSACGAWPCPASPVVLQETPTGARCLECGAEHTT